jgi:hypothetical protein
MNLRLMLAAAANAEIRAGRYAEAGDLHALETVMAEVDIAVTAAIRSASAGTELSRALAALRDMI